MMLREPDRSRVAGEVVQTQRGRIEERDGQNTLADGQVPDPPSRIGVDPIVDEREQRTVRVAYSERTVGSAGQIFGRANDPPQRRIEIKVRADLDDHMEQLLHLIAGGQQLIELRMHPAYQPTLAQTGKNRAAIVVGHPVCYLQPVGP